MYTLPTHISRYEIKSRIGRGGMGDLYLALDPNTNRLVALKLLNATLDSSELRERFAREARALAALNHQNIVNIYDTGEFEDSPFIVMEYVRGETLAEMIKRRATLSVSQKLKLMEELCAGLAQAHEAGIIHRDVKPANLMVDQQGRLKILDFGIARVAEGNRTRVGPLTQVNMLIGTPGYMSPEQIEGGEVDHRSDIFAVGAVCYELLAYDEAFAGANTRQIESRVLRGQPTPLASVVPGLDPEIDEIVLRALKRDPNKRYQDAATFERALQRLRLRLEPDAPATPHRPTPPPPQNLRGQTREARAEAAYQRALAVYQGGSPDAARRSAVEALAENPSHAGARALLARLEHRAPLLETSRSASPPEPASPTLVGTSVAAAAQTPASAPTLLSGSTIVSGATSVSGSTSVSGPTRASRPTIASAPTILINPTVARAPARWKRYRARWGSLGLLRKRREQPGKGVSASRKGDKPLWTRYPQAALAVALLIILIGVAAVVMFFAWLLRPSGQMLTITKPVGGTISAAGIRCGTRGADCTASRPKGESIELVPEADTGFTFVGYTGDCAPGGRTTMTVPRTCGATFESIPLAPVVATQVLTIAPVPTGGTLEGVDILCGTKGSLCSGNYPENVPVELHPTADPGFTFMGFVGDCAPLGHTQMTGPRTCGATFSPTAVADKAPVLAPRISGVRGSSRREPVVDTAKPPSEGPASANPRPNPSSSGTPPSSGVIVVPPTAVDPKQVAPPPSDDDFAKSKIKDLLKEYCDAHEALDPLAVQRIFPKVNMASLQIQLNKSKYKSVQCKFADPVFVSLDSSAGTAKVQADVKRVFEHTAVKEKPQVDETTAVMTLSRPSARSPWVIDTVTYKPK